MWYIIIKIDSIGKLNEFNDSKLGFSKLNKKAAIIDNFLIL